MTAKAGLNHPATRMVTAGLPGLHWWVSGHDLPRPLLRKQLAEVSRCPSRNSRRRSLCRQTEGFNRAHHHPESEGAEIMTPSEGNVGMGDRAISLELLIDELNYARSKIAEAEMNSEVRRRRLLDEWQPKVAALVKQIKEMEGTI